MSHSLLVREKISDWRDTAARFGRLAKWFAQFERDLIRLFWHRTRKADEEQKREQLSEFYDRWAEGLVSILQDNGGTWVKVGQFLSCRPDMMPPEFIGRLSNLQTKAKPVPFALIYPVLVDHWGNNWEKLFDSFDVVPQHTASVAQVYRAKLIDGQTVAVKVVLPGVEARFKHDARVLRWFAKGLNKVISGFNWEAVMEQFIDMTSDEFDLRNEINNIERMQSYYANDFKMPKVFREYSGSTVMVMTWIEGEPLWQFLNRANDPSTGLDPAPVLSLMAKLYMRQIASIGLFHADPHPGNVIVMPNGELGFIDFGAVGELSATQRLALNGLLAMVFGYVPPDFSTQLSLAGFRGVEPQVMQQIQEAVAGTREEADFSGVLIVLLEVFRTSRVEMPGAFVAVVRVLLTVSGYLSKYNVDFDYFQGVLK